VFVQAKYKIFLSLSNIGFTTRRFEFIQYIASLNMCLLVLVLKMISNRLCSMNEIVEQVLSNCIEKNRNSFLVVVMFHQRRACTKEFFEYQSCFLACF